MSRPLSFWLPVLLLPLCWVWPALGSGPTDDQLHAVRMRIDQIEKRLDRLASEAEGVTKERQQLDAQLELADARVREIELLLEESSREAELLRTEAARVGAELDERREILEQHLEIMALLGRPGPVQLLFDAYRGGELEEALGTVSVLTAGQIKLMDEYRHEWRRHGIRLAELSQTLDQAQEEAQQLEARREELSEVRQRVALRLKTLERSQANAGASLEDLRDREASLERLVGVLSSKQRFSGREDVRRYRGALPWPVSGPVVQTFGRQRLAKYNTYTVCNGLRFETKVSARVTAVFPGVVAYASHFKGYGNMVVLDHGHGVYSLVAGLATIHVRVDQQVTMGMQLGLASPPDEGGNIYFEFRVNEKPEDPKRWLQLERGSS